ncbi:hypothetical protein BN2476_130094 [Paraburkholderia piptadeniae]|uniref:Uncharacterized protein n=1 Tax=Paraburkholderia piptadeniae TaxID=1701573 RepID=A0A1N7RRT6_9BURK|nr:hypothetical protein [Paraburkholderia piptadeniae]SIT37769.1 hypothetical protein BN2476_130094 [Paraburkholderia piptadeniae]
MASHASIVVTKGGTIHFVVKGAGKVRHEMTRGAKQELKEHADVGGSKRIISNTYQSPIASTLSEPLLTSTAQTQSQEVG